MRDAAPGFASRALLDRAYSLECLANIVDTSLSGRRVGRELAAIAERRGLPCMVVSDNGTGLTSLAVLAWCQDTGVEWRYIAPGQAAAE